MAGVSTMDKNGFYVTLPSNSSLGVYPNNKIGCYRTKLSRTIVLNEPHEVGLIEIQYPKAWNSFPVSDSNVDIYDMKNSSTSTIVMARAYYENIPELVKEFNELFGMLPYMGGMMMRYHIVKQHVYFSGPSKGLSFTFRGKVAAMLGFNPGEPFKTPPDREVRFYYAPHRADVHGGCYNMFIYSDIVNYQAVGDSYVPLLRSINVADEQRSIPTLTYDRPHYTSLSRNIIDDIEIALKDDQNQYIPFLYGKVTVKLHFRPIKQFF